MYFITNIDDTICGDGLLLDGQIRVQLKLQAMANQVHLSLKQADKNTAQSALGAKHDELHEALKASEGLTMAEAAATNTAAVAAAISLNQQACWASHGTAKCVSCSALTQQLPRSGPV